MLATGGIQSHKKVPKLLNGQVHIKPSENGEIDSHQSVPFKETLLLFCRYKTILNSAFKFFSFMYCPHIH